MIDQSTHDRDRSADLQALDQALATIAFAPDGTILRANPKFLQLLGYEVQEVVGRNHAMFWPVEHAALESYRTFWASARNGESVTADYHCLRKDGSDIWLQAILTPVLNADGNVAEIVTFATDVTAQKLRAADDRGQIAAINNSQAVIHFALDGTVLDANDLFLQIMGYERDEIVGRHHRMFAEPGFDELASYAEFWEMLRAGSFLSAKFKRIGKGGKEVWIQATYNPILDLNGRPFKIIKIVSDVTEDVARAARVTSAKRQAQYDTTTSLPNRIRLASFMTDALAKPDMRLAIFYMDLDHFKSINDTYGRDVGDHVLRETADRLRRALTEEQLVARVGGAEFVVAVPNLSNAEIEALCTRLIAIVKAPIRYDKGIVTIGISIGIAVSPDDATTSDALLRCADVALYRSKGRGRGSYKFFSTDVEEKIAVDRHLADDMLHGIKAGEFFIEYQPRFDAHTRGVQGVEALVRWTHPMRGRVGPGEFIPVAEASGLIIPLGEWVLRTACAAATAWPGLSLSVNVSPVQFRSSDLVEIIENILSETGFAPERLELEIPESALLENPERAHAVLDIMKALGVRLALGGFGPGPSSIGYLRTFPFDGIKIDRQFISEIDKQEGGRKIVQSMLDLGKSLGIAVTAEGVETAAQFLLLRLDDCSEVQGFLLAQPMSAAGISELLAQHDRPLTAVG